MTTNPHKALCNEPGCSCSPVSGLSYDCPQHGADAALNEHRMSKPTQRGGKPNINTDAVRGMVRARIIDMERHNENPGAIYRDTIPGLCDEVDYLRATVTRVEAMHVEDGEGWCADDGFSWPCRTVRALAGDS